MRVRVRVRVRRRAAWGPRAAPATLTQLPAALGALAALGVQAALAALGVLAALAVLGGMAACAVLRGPGCPTVGGPGRSVTWLSPHQALAAWA